ncbi:MAG: helix-turn-helix transcriptional regulator [Alphaproteobacteria bacterium]|nr:helix-turn-helix transcriptional regulator [Alphaproteobacteria bacterium]
MTDEQLRLEVRQRLRALREARGWSQRELSAASGINQSEISNYERGERLPRLETCLRLASTYDMSIAGLLTLPSDRPDPDTPAIDQLVARLAHQPAHIQRAAIVMLMALLDSHENPKAL